VNAGQKVQRGAGHAAHGRDAAGRRHDLMVAKGTLRSLIRSAGMTMEDFESLAND
jgi:hypothetical protein